MAKKRTLAFLVGGVAALGVAALVVKSATAQITVSPPPSVVTTVTMSPSALSTVAGQTITFSGRVLDQNGAGMGSITVYLFVNNSNQGSVPTDSNGNYSFAFTFLQAGTFSVDASNNANNT